MPVAHRDAATAPGRARAAGSEPADAPAECRPAGSKAAPLGENGACRKCAPQPGLLPTPAPSPAHSPLRSLPSSTTTSTTSPSAGPWPSRAGRIPATRAPPSDALETPPADPAGPTRAALPGQDLWAGDAAIASTGQVLADGSDAASSVILDGRWHPAASSLALEVSGEEESPTATPSIPDIPSAAANGNGGSSPDSLVSSTLDAAQGGAAKRGLPKACLFVASLTSSERDADLHESLVRLFSTYGPLVSVKVCRDFHFRPYAFVHFENVDDAATALEKAAHMPVNGRPIRIEQARVNRTLFFSKFDRQLSEADLRVVFESVGPIEGFRVLQHRVTGRSRRCGFVQYEFREDATRAFVQLRRQYPKMSLEWSENMVGADAPGCDEREVLVGAIPPACATEGILRNRFATYGTIQAVQVTVAPSGETDANAVITFVEASSAAAATEHENGAEWHGNRLRVQVRPWFASRANPRTAHGGASPNGSRALTDWRMFAAAAMMTTAAPPPATAPPHLGLVAGPLAPLAPFARSSAIPLPGGPVPQAWGVPVGPMGAGDHALYAPVPFDRYAGAPLLLPPGGEYAPVHPASPVGWGGYAYGHPALRSGTVAAGGVPYVPAGFVPMCYAMDGQAAAPPVGVSMAMVPMYSAVSPGVYAGSAAVDYGAGDAGLRSGAPPSSSAAAPTEPEAA